MATDPITIDIRTTRVVKTLGALTLTAGIAFFSYSAYAATILGEGSTQIFIGVAFLLMMLGSHFLTGKLMQAIHQL